VGVGDLLPGRGAHDSTSLDGIAGHEGEELDDRP
jgi:hypothetical protein